MMITPGDVWFVNFPLEEDPNRYLPRPVIVVDEETLQVLSIKVTKSAPRENDKYDIPLRHWQHAKLRFESTARVSKIMYLPKSYFKHKIGELHPDDFLNILKTLEQFLDEHK